MPGHEIGHRTLRDHGGVDWEQYVSGLVKAHGGWTGLADELLRRGQSLDGFPSDLGTVEKGLRRLARRGHHPGGKYGKWLLRFFGVEKSLERWVAWLCQYHSRFADLPTALRLAQLNLWETPPLTESNLQPWFDIGVASVLHRRRHYAESRSRLLRGHAHASKAGDAAVLESKLFLARIRTDEGKRAEGAELLDQAANVIESARVRDDDYHCYFARLQGQRAYHLTKPLDGEAENIEGAVALFDSIDPSTGIPFVEFRRAAGLAYCRWRQGRTEEAVGLARSAAEAAADGGHVRLRIMAMNMLSRMLAPDEGEAVRKRANRVAKTLEDEDLVHRTRSRREG